MLEDNVKLMDNVKIIDNVELIECPQCGSLDLQVKKLTNKKTGGIIYFVECEDCGTSGPLNSKSMLEEEIKILAKLAWNRRAKPLDEGSACCPFCGCSSYGITSYYIGDDLDTTLYSPSFMCNNCGASVTPDDPELSAEVIREELLNLWRKLYSLGYI